MTYRPLNPDDYPSPAELALEHPDHPANRQLTLDGREVPHPPQEATRAAESAERPESQAPPPGGARGAPTAATGALIVHPGTGEVLDLATAPTDQIADWRLELVEAKRSLDSLAEDLDLELGRRIDLEAVRTVHIAGYDLTIDAPTFAEYDLPRLGIALEALVEDGRISRAAAERAIKVEVKRSAVQRELNRLLAHADPEVRDAVAATRSEVERTRRRVTVKRAA